MAIILRLDRMMADRKISLNELSEKVGIANVNLSKIKTGKVSAISPRICVSAGSIKKRSK
ncbi:helix-turn-helix domain-containing protein, partial [Fusicatenibacter saccharivorans]|uniref:helix-turn-helix domain-containing protein n=1 Tax=Fusicatenibacter saccharivorans TaxID=1150298 RepID=UPI001D121043